jgi:hypothetical protein
MAKARIKRREGRQAYLNTLPTFAAILAVVALVVWVAQKGDSGVGGAPGHEKCWTDPSTGQIVQCEAP